MRATTPRHINEFLAHIEPLCLSRTESGDALITAVTTDSRSVRPGAIFCAIPGSRDDGAHYVDAALRAGAAAVVSQTPVPLPPGMPHALVTDAYAAAGRLAEVMLGFPARALRLYGVTGTNGKTTCAFLLRAILSRSGAKPGMIGTIHHAVGRDEQPAARTTPPPVRFQQLLRQMVDSGLDTAVIEASSHALQQRRMGTAKFAAALFTNLTHDHLDYHGTFEHYYQAKKRLFSEYLARNATAVINGDDEYGVRLVSELSDEKLPVQTCAFGHGPEATARITHTQLDWTGCRFDLTCPRYALPQQLESPLIGQHNVANVAGAVVLAASQGLPPSVIRDAVASFHGAPGRLQPIRCPAGFTAFVDYAHTDDALRHVLQALRQLEPNRILTVFGCGGDRDAAKRPLMGKVASALSDRVYVTSDNPRSEEPLRIIEQIAAGIAPAAECRRIPDRREAIRQAITDARRGDVVLIAGKGHETYQEQKGQHTPFDDVLEVRAAMTNLGLEPESGNASASEPGPVAVSSAVP